MTSLEQRIALDSDAAKLGLVAFRHGIRTAAKEWTSISVVFTAAFVARLAGLYPEHGLIAQFVDTSLYYAPCIAVPSGLTSLWAWTVNGTMRRRLVHLGEGDPYFNASTNRFVRCEGKPAPGFERVADGEHGRGPSLSYLKGCVVRRDGERRYLIEWEGRRMSARAALRSEPVLRSAYGSIMDAVVDGLGRPRPRLVGLLEPVREVTYAAAR